MSLSRRQFFRRAGALALAVPVVRALSACDADEGTRPADTSAGDAPDSTDGADTADTAPLPEYTYDGPLGPEALFEHGVASGDPWPDRVILWTRTSVDGGAAGPDAEVFWELALDPAFATRLAAGWLTARGVNDHCVKVDVIGLAPGTTYYYRFMALGRTSPIGRTRTTATGPLARMRLAVCSCSNLPEGYFHGYREIAARPELDLVVHLGDYIYEYGENPAAVRPSEPDHELTTLTDYRTRYAQYRRDAHLQEAHRQHPWVLVWDDHESVNNSARDGGEDHRDADDGPWAERKAAAIQAWHEWLPVREASDRHIFRSFHCGDLVDLIMLDTRLWGRDQQVPVASDAEAAPDRQLLGADQEAWLRAELAASTARWTLIGQQVMMGQLRVAGTTLNPDQWDGYPAARDRFYDAVEAAPNLQNLVVLTGDIHSSWAIDLKRDGATYDPATGAGALGVEIVVPGITSSGLASDPTEVLQMFPEDITHIQWVEATQRGYVIVDVDHEALEATWYHFDHVELEQDEGEIGAVFVTRAGTPHLVRAESPRPAPATAPPFAP